MQVDAIYTLLRQKDRPMLSSIHVIYIIHPICRHHYQVFARGVLMWHRFTSESIEELVMHSRSQN